MSSLILWYPVGAQIALNSIGLSVQLFVSLSCTEGPNGGLVMSTFKIKKHPFSFGLLYQGPQRFPFHLFSICIRSSIMSSIPLMSLPATTWLSSLAWCLQSSIFWQVNFESTLNRMSDTFFNSTANILCLVKLFLTHQTMDSRHFWNLGCKRLLFFLAAP